MVTKNLERTFLSLGVCMRRGRREGRRGWREGDIQPKAGEEGGEMEWDGGIAGGGGHRVNKMSNSWSGCFEGNRLRM